MVERFDVRHLLPAVWLGSLLTVVLVSLWPEGAREDEALNTVWWNMAHVPAYAGLTLLTFLVAAQWILLTSGRLFWLALGMALMGLLIEVLQPYFGRTADVADALCNLAGILLALGIFFISRWRQGARRRAG